MAPSEDHHDDEDDRRTKSLAGLAFSLALVVIGLFLIQRLAENSRLQDCLMAGRGNCAPVNTAAANK